MTRSPREVAEQVRRMVAGEGVEFADLFAEDGVLVYPFSSPGHPAELRGREAIRAFFAGRPGPATRPHRRTRRRAGQRLTGKMTSPARHDRRPSPTVVPCGR